MGTVRGVLARDDRFTDHGRGGFWVLLCCRQPRRILAYATYLTVAARLRRLS